MAKGLQGKQIAFCKEYISNGNNARQAAKAAGYKNIKASAEQNMANEAIRAYIAELQAEADKIAGRDIMTLAEIQARRSAIARGEIKDDFGFGPDAGEQLKAMNDLEKALSIQAEQEAKRAAEEAARHAAPYHTDLDIIPDTFHPVIRQLRNAERLEIILKGGRGSAKSTSGTEYALEWLKNNPECHALVMRQVADTLKTSIYAQFEWSANKQAENPLFDRDNWNFGKSPLEITYKPTGQKIYFRGADDPGKIKSIKVPFGYIGLMIWEELDQFAGPEAVRKIEQSALRGGPKAINIKIFNPPISKNNWANVYADEPKDGKIVHHSTYLDVPPEWLGEYFISEAEHLKEVAPDAYRHEYLGEPIGIGTEIFKFLEIRTITDEEIARQEYIYQGQDWGWDPDPKAFIRLAYSHKTETIMLIDEDGGTCIRTKDMAQRIIDKGYNDFEIRCGVDEPEHINDYKDAGLAARPAIVTPGSVRRTMEWLQCRKIIIDPARTPRAYKEFTEYEHDVDKNDEIIDGYPDRKNHWIDATRYATSPLSMRRGESA